MGLRATWDSWRNALTGLGGRRDKREAAKFAPGQILDWVTLENLYNENDLARIVCETLPTESLRQGYELRIQDKPDLETQICSRLEELGAKQKLLDAAVWGRLFGVGAILLGADDGQDVSEPLNLDQVKALKFLTVLDREDIYPLTWYSNPLDPKYGEAETYIFNNYLMGRPASPEEAKQKALLTGARVHESRLLFFWGARTTKRARLRNQGWPFSVLQAVYTVLRDFDVSWQGASYLLTEASQAVYGVKGLVDILASEQGQELLAKRMETIEMSRSVARALIIDADGETFERKPTSFSGIPELLDRFMSRLSAATRIPVTILMGQSPAGLNATGASDLRWFYDTVAAYQSDVMQPALKKLVHLLLVEDGQAEPDSWIVEFPSLYQLTELETATLRKTVAETDNIYEAMGAITAEEIALSRWPAEGYSMETTVNLELRAEIQDIKEVQVVDLAKNPPPVVDPNAPPAKAKAPAPAPKAG